MTLGGATVGQSPLGSVGAIRIRGRAGNDRISVSGLSVKALLDGRGG